MEEKLTYKSAMEEIESLVKLLEENKLDVDELSEKVKRMAVLVEFCKGKLHRTEEDVNNVFSDLCVRADSNRRTKFVGKG